VGLRVYLTGAVEALLPMGKGGGEGEQVSLVGLICCVAAILPAPSPGAADAAAIPGREISER
jgi:hypothetical protein